MTNGECESDGGITGGGGSTGGGRSTGGGESTGGETGNTGGGSDAVGNSSACLITLPYFMKSLSQIFPMEPMEKHLEHTWHATRKEQDVSPLTVLFYSTSLVQR